MERIIAEIGSRNQEMLTFLERLVNIDSGVDNPEGICQVAQIVGDKLNELGFRTEYVEYPGVCAHLLAHKNGAGNKNVMILGHLDTVFPKGTAAARPFCINDGKAYGPGVLDMKGGITAALFALEAMYKNGWEDKNITVFFCGDEEPGHPKTDAVEIIEREASGKDAVFNMEPGRVDGGVVIGRNGVAAPELFIAGRSAHAGSDPENGASALRELAYKLIELEKLTNLETGTVVNVGIVKGGISNAVVPGEAYAAMSVRFKNMDEAHKAMAAVRDIVNRTYVSGTQTRLENDHLIYMPMETTDKVLELTKLVQEQGRKLGISEIKGCFSGGGSDAAWPAGLGVPTVCAMGPQGAFMHSEREFMVIDGLIKRAQLLALCIDAV